MSSSSNTTTAPATALNPAIHKVVMIDGLPEVDMTVEYDEYEYMGGDGFYGWIPKNTGYPSKIVPFRYSAECWIQVGFTRCMNGIDGEEAQAEFLNVLNSVLPKSIPQPKRILNKNGKNMTFYLNKSV